MNHWRKKQIDEQIFNWVSSTHEQLLDVRDGGGKFNYKCFLNAVQYACDNDCEVLEVIIFGMDLSPTLHYVNRKDGEVLETTLGFQADKHAYYLIRTVPRVEWMNIDGAFGISLSAWLHRFTNWFDRAVLRIDRVV